MDKKILLIFAAVLVFMSALLYFSFISYPQEIDLTSVVTNVVDGDTFDIATNDRIRLADIDTPEEGNEPVYSLAKNYLEELIGSRIIYLDIDDVYRTDYQGTGTRLVCVAYIDHNSTHYLNVNQALLEENLAIVDEFDNQFNHQSWTRYPKKNTIPESNP
ncbi:thermonuclease family protein [Candidatus Bathyarchaeota archaeon]|nr:thermonuclease family protein [Candidatus Bathyarchaeota archaeon]